MKDKLFSATTDAKIQALLRKRDRQHGLFPPLPGSRSKLRSEVPPQLTFKNVHEEFVRKKISKSDF